MRSAQGGKLFLNSEGRFDLPARFLIFLMPNSHFRFGPETGEAQAIVPLAIKPRAIASDHAHIESCAPIAGARCQLINLGLLRLKAINGVFQRGMPANWIIGQAFRQKPLPVSVALNAMQSALRVRDDIPAIGQLHFFPAICQGQIVGPGLAHARFERFTLKIHL